MLKIHIFTPKLKDRPVSDDTWKAKSQCVYAPKVYVLDAGLRIKTDLRIRSFNRNDMDNGLTMTFNTEDHHQAFPGMINGGIIGTLLDCHSNWTAAMAIMNLHGDSEPPCTVTANYTVQLRRPTPHGAELTVISEVTELLEDRASIGMEMFADDKLVRKGKGLFVAVKEGHPAYIDGIEAIK